MAKLRIDQGELVMAFSSGDGMMTFFLDRETGAVVWVSDDEMTSRYFEDEDDEDGANDAEFADELATWPMIERNRERFLEIPSHASHEGFRLMEDFVASLERGAARDALTDALERRSPFRSFKDALASFPKVRVAWFAYEFRRLREDAEAWLRSNGIGYELVSAGEAPDGEAG